ncbi:MAG: VanW protein, partial [Paenibacillus sp.]|nr:VanW protein [Paenibacillus sp.]
MVRYRITILVCLLFFTAGTFASMAWYGMRDELPSGLTIDNWDVGGISLSELERQLTHKRELMLQQTVRLFSDRPEVPVQPADWTMEQLGLEVRLQELTDRLQPLHSGSAFQRAVYRWKLRHQKWAVPLEMNASRLQETLKRGFPALYENQPVDAQRIVGPNDTVSYVPEIPVMRIDEPALLKQLKGSIPSLDTVAWTAGAQENRQGRGQAGASYKEITEANAAKEAGDRDTAGKAIQITAGAPRITIPLSFIKQEPKLTVRMLQAQGIERKISEFTTLFPLNGLNGEGRIHNIRSTASS